LQCVAVCCSVLQCVAVCCNVLQCVAVCCSVLQCSVALSCNVFCHRIPSIRLTAPPDTLQHLNRKHSKVLQRVAVYCSVLQRVAAFYSVLQCVAVCCSVLHSKVLKRQHSQKFNLCSV